MTSDRHVRRRYGILPALFLLMVAAGPLYSWYADVAHGNTPDANIGYGLGFIWAAGWGMPWSLWPWTNPPASDVAEMAAYVVCGLINVAVIVAALAWRNRRMDRDDSAH